jgi:hypothetical protein
MYENPKLQRLGDADDVILGISEDGEDLDAQYIPPPWDFASNADVQPR